MQDQHLPKTNSLDHDFNRGWQGKRWLFHGSSLKTMQSKNKIIIMNVNVNQWKHTGTADISYVIIYLMYIFVYILMCMWSI